MDNQKFSLTKRIRSFGFAFQGLKTVLREEHNARIHALAAVGVILLGFGLNISKGEWLAITIVIGFVFVTEILNTAIENIADFVSPEKNSAIKKIKDLAAAGVLVSAFIAAVVGLIVFGSRMLEVW
jgi:diacylglycerol kinase (ATP)